MKENKYATLFLRLGIGFVILWCGLGQIVFRYRPTWFDEFLATFPLLEFLFPLYAGTFALVIGGMLILGIFTRYVAVISVLYFIGRIFLISFGVDSGFWYVWQDVGLLTSAVALSLVGSDWVSVDKLMNK